MTQSIPINQSIEHLDPEKLSALVDGELPTTGQQGIEQHLTICHTCTLRVLSATQLKAATARAGHRFAAPPEALARLTAQLRFETQAKPQAKPQLQAEIMRTALTYSASSLRPAAWTALAAAILLTVSLLGWRQVHQTKTLAAEFLDQHLATLSTGAAPQVISTDRHTVKPWFQGRLPFSFNLPDATDLPPDTTLKGADLTYLNGQPAALLLFAIHKHEVSFFLTQRSSSPTLTALPSTLAGFNLRTATTPDLRIIAVSDVNASDLDNLMAALTQAQESVQISK
jgi:anti-sigma factor RsiW